MNCEATRSRRSKQRGLDRFVRDVCQHMEQVAGAATMLSVTPAMGARQKSLLWTFALLVAQRNTSADEDHDNGPYLRCCLSELSRAEQECVEFARAAGPLRERIQATDSVAILAQCDERVSGPFPLAHLFEMLVAGHDRAARRARGAYYTPYPLVQCIVRSVDRLLERELQLPGGLFAEEPRMCLIDPACGSGMFLLGALAHLGGAAHDSQPAAAVGYWLRAHRLCGIDLMPASCGAARLLLEQQLPDPARAAPAEDGRPEPWSLQCGSPLADESLSQELLAGCLPVIVGNPPYSNFGRRNREPWILEQLREYKRNLREKKLNLHDDFIKFIRWSQFWVDRAGKGVVALVVNNTFLAGVTHRQMRASLASSFDQIYLLDLHGSRKKREVAPSGSLDENVFPIQQGVAIALFVKTGQSVGPCRVWHADLWGTRNSKLETLSRSDVTNTPWMELLVTDPSFFFVPRTNRDEKTYLAWPRLDEIFDQYVSGVQSKRDKLFVGFTRDEVAQRMREFLTAAREGVFGPGVPYWLRSKASGAGYDDSMIRRYMVAPFDVRWIYYDPHLLGRARFSLLRHLLYDNLALVFMRQTTNAGPYDHFLATNVLVSDRVFYSAHGAPFVAPLYRRDQEGVSGNLKPQFVAELAGRLGAVYAEANQSDADHFDARDVLDAIYAAVHDADYRQRYRELLSVDFPRVPWPADLEQFRQWCATGKQLVAAHLNALAPASSADQCPVAAPLEIQAGFPRWDAGRLELSPDCVWPEKVDESVWNARVGGYQVLQRWLKQRVGRSVDPVVLQRLVHALRGL